MRKRRKPRIDAWMGIPVVLGLALLMPFWFHHLPKASDAPRAASRGESLIRAVEQYRQDHGSLPATLDELRPRYLDYVPYPGTYSDRPYVLRRPDVESDRMWTAGCPYAITVDLAPAGTLVYRRSHEYGDLSTKAGGRPIGRWYLSYID